MTDILIRGAGLLGTSLGLALSQTGARTHLEDLDPSVVATAVAMGAGSVKRWMASETITPTATSSSTALAREARMVALRRP